ncbi:hypothetical protein TH53_04520 [Pedobacter lusitanus]|uniref:DUF4142 domain-containing protein n=1 Tax=Pedobacter lusitanus TaxID=1503925 RepID=A0A0D0G0H0_9SPHI|nr:DUF4142 domain-containing protein [Pedobacter lusitanus]KIO78284.1 hypothetical protein TH53_04520 [Pedobacter lusitanus]
MENLRNYAIIAIAICTIAMCSTENAPAENKDYICRPADSLNTEHFIKQMSASNAKELSLSKLAKKRSRNSKVREYATRVMDACILANSDLAPFAILKNIKMPDSVTIDSDNSYTTLQQSGRADFDKEYLSMITDSHNQAIALLTNMAMARDTAISSFADKHLPVFRRHLDEGNYLSRHLHRKMKTS